jgi:hypothetical protein
MISPPPKKDIFFTKYAIFYGEGYYQKNPPVTDLLDDDTLAKIYTTTVPGSLDKKGGRRFHIY